VNDSIGAMDDEQLAAVQKHPAIKAEVAKIKLERANQALKAAEGGADLSALFGKK